LLYELQISTLPNLTLSASVPCYNMAVLVCDPWPSRLPNASNGSLSINLVYVKVPKTGSSTFSGILRRVAAHNGMSGAREGTWIQSEPGLFASHYPGLGIGFESLRQHAAMLRLPRRWLATVREPTSAALSRMYHLGPGLGASNETKLAYMYNISNMQVRYLGGGEANKVFISYDFIAVPERMDESAVLVAQMFGLPLRDVLFSDAKRKPHPLRSEESPEMQHFLATQFALQNKQDALLWNLAMSSIARQFRDSFDLRRRLTGFRELRAQSASQCSSIASYNKHCFPVMDEDRCGCYFRDNGCDFRCHDEMTDRLCAK
jgi:hypothetical protein